MITLLNKFNAKPSQQTVSQHAAKQPAKKKPNCTTLGQMFFTSMSHHLYDLSLYRFITNKIWCCPTERLLDNYADNITNNHLEIGVGSGYFLHHTLCADFLNRLALLDLNKRCLTKSARRLKVYKPVTLHQSALSPFSPAIGGYSSVGMNYVLHCIPGSFGDNRGIFDNVHAALADNGVFFGATLLPGRANGRLAARAFMRLLNLVGIFRNDTRRTNDKHRVEDLKGVLESVFAKVELTLVGDAVIFCATKRAASSGKNPSSPGDSGNSRNSGNSHNRGSTQEQS